MPIDLFYCDHVDFPLPAAHKFPLRKYGLVREVLQQDPRFVLEGAPSAALEDISRVHDPTYISSFIAGTLEHSVMRRIGLPWSDGLVRRTLASLGGTLAATATALQKGVSGTLAGGTHHAFRAEGSGFCVFNDLAVAAEWARAKAGISRIAIVDLDVHQGDGTAAIFENDPGIFTLSFHGARNFPFRKQRSRLDREFPDAATEAEYMPTLKQALPEVWRFGPELILFQSGVDGLASDKLGRLAFSQQGLRTRDEVILCAAWERRIPVVITMGGGYSDPIERTVEGHVQTFEVAAGVYL